MPNHYRALCAELLAEYENSFTISEPSDDPLVQRARALLAQPVAEGRSSDGGYEAGSMWAGHPIRPSADERTTISNVAEGPSADEWDALVVRAWDQYETVGYLGERFMYDSDFGNALDLVRRELARFGRPTPQPVAASERLPGPGDLAPWPDAPDASHWCWFGSEMDGASVWEQRSAAFTVQFYYASPSAGGFTHWLPANALPTPEATNDLHS